jgi:glycosyltransferase involved in cell wall biosynthesis
MKIAVLASSYPRFEGDGTAPFVKSICEHLAKAGHQVEVVAPYDPLVNPAQQGTVPVHRFRYIWPNRWSIMGHARSLEADVRLKPFSYLLLPFFLLSAFFTLMAVTRRQHTDAIHIHWVVPNGPAGALAAILRGIPYIVSLHGSDIYLAKKNRLFGLAAKMVFQRAAGVTACSKELQEAAFSLGASKNTQLLAWGADPVLFSPEMRRIDFRENLQIPDSSVLVLAMGRMVYKKGFDILLKALPQVIAACPEAHLVLAGDGAIRSELEQLSIQLGIQRNVTFTGRIPWNEVPGYLASADIFVLPSVRDVHGNIDGLPTVLPEAMACGAAVIASDIGGVNLVVHDAENGLLVPPGDVDTLANTLIMLFSNEETRKTLGQAARQAVLKQFNWTMVASEIGKLLEIAVHG